MLRALPTTEGARGEQAGELRLQDRVGVPRRVGRRSRGRQQCQGQTARREGPAWTAVDREAECGGAGDDGDDGPYGQVERAVADVVGDLVLEAGETFGVVDEGLGTDGVELVDVHVEAEGGGVAAQLQGAQRGDVDLRAAGEGGAQGHRGVHGADRRPDVPDDQQAQPRAEQDDGDEAEGAGPRVGLVDEFDDRVRTACAVVACEGAGSPSYVVQSGHGSGGAGHWSRMPRCWRRYAAWLRLSSCVRGRGLVRGPVAPARPYRTMALCWR